jgi:hypothetical protein
MIFTDLFFERSLLSDLFLNDRFSAIFAPLPAAHFEFDRRAFEAKAPANLIDDVAVMGEVQWFALVGEQDERGRTDACLRNVEDFAFVKMQ